MATSKPIAILRALELHGVGLSIDIGPVLDKLFPDDVDSNTVNAKRKMRASEVQALLDSLLTRELLTGPAAGFNGSDWEERRPIYAKITDRGAEKLYANELRESVLRTETLARRTYWAQWLFFAATTGVALVALLISLLTYRRDRQNNVNVQATSNHKTVARNA